MRLWTIVLATGVLAGCGQPATSPSIIPQRSAPSAPTEPSPSASPAATYLVTLTASSSCAEKLPLAARERSYTATLFTDGRIEWAAPTLNPPSGHRPSSSGRVDQAQARFSFSIDVERDPQSDDFHGLWDDLGEGTFLNISGNGIGTIDGRRTTGTLAGLFAFFEPVVPRNPSVLLVGHYCSASDHPFTFVQQ